MLVKLEHALAAQFDPEHLMVYGDYLQSIGDPRGELIALDLNGRDEPERRAALTASWLGPDGAELTPIATFEHGFIANLHLGSDRPRSDHWLEAGLDGPSVHYLRGLTIVGNTAWVTRVIGQLVRQPRVWLHRLSIQATGVRPTPAVSAELASALAEVTPRLEILKLSGHRVLDTLSHATVRSLHVTGWDALETLHADNGVPDVGLPALESLDLAFHTENDGEPVDRAALSRLLSPARLPKLHRLDLSRNEPGTTLPYSLGGEIDAIRFLHECPISGQLTHVQMPSVPDQAAAARLADAITRLPALSRLVVLRQYHNRSVALPAGAEVESPLRWLPVEEQGPELIGYLDRPLRRGALALPLPLPLRAIVEWLERNLATLAPEPRARWFQLFEDLSSNGWQGVRRSRAHALAMLDVLDADDRTLAAWIRLRGWMEQSPMRDGVVFRWCHSR